MVQEDESDPDDAPGLNVWLSIPLGEAAAGVLSLIMIGRETAKEK